MTRTVQPPNNRAFTIVELLVCIGIIALLMAMLLPALKNARMQANSVACKAHLHDIGSHLIIYANTYRGMLYPVGSVVQFGERWPGAFAEIGRYRTLGNNSHYPNGQIIPKEGRWPVYVFDPPVWNPKIMVCPQDMDVLSDASGEQHSYILNHHLEYSPIKRIKFGTRILSTDADGVQITKSTSEVVIMGEKRTTTGDYYMERGDFDPPKEIVEKYRHGIRLGSNYLYLDMHVDTVPPKEAQDALDPWDPVPKLGT